MRVNSARPEPSIRVRLCGLFICGGCRHVKVNIVINLCVHCFRLLFSSDGSFGAPLIKRRYSKKNSLESFNIIKRKVDFEVIPAHAIDY